MKPRLCSCLDEQKIHLSPLAMSTKHIPAWKRLGLKLKHANDDAEVPGPNPISILKDGKRKQDWQGDDSSHSRRQLKKPRFDVNGNKGKLSRAGDVPENTNSTVSASKKTVSFTTDTKAEDGDSAQTIQFITPDSPGSTPKKLDETRQHRLTDNEESDSLVPQKRKKERKLKPKGGHLNNPTPRKARAAVDYLQQFQKDRSAWKFNKNHETWLLKNTLSTDSIDAGYNYALAYYVSQLKSKGARQRLAEQSHMALAKQKGQESYNDADSDSARNRLFQALNAESGELDEAESKWIGSVDRAVLILWSLNEGLSDSKTKFMASAKSMPRTKKNKSRTSRIDIDLSSSSESESDASSSDSVARHDEVVQKLTKIDTRTKGGRTLGDTLAKSTSELVTSETSSDDTSTSGSDSE